MTSGSRNAASSPPSGLSGLLRRSGALLGIGAVMAALVGVGAVVLGGHPDGGTTDSSPRMRPQPPTDTPGRAPGHLLVGTQFQGTWSTYTDDERRTILDDLVDIGIKTVRISISWAMLQPDRPTTDDAGWSWTYGVPRVDSVVRMALSRGLTVHATFGRTPSWANDGAGEGAAPTSLVDWRRAVAFVAHRYAGKVSSWEVWNEPNHATYFLNGTPGAYTDLLCAAYPILHAADSGTPVVYGGLSGNDWRFLEASYRDGAKGCFDVMAVHPYQRWGFSPDAPAPDLEPWYFSNVSLIRGVQERHDDLKPVWFTEFGWSTHPNAPGTPEYLRGVSEQLQARYLVRTLQLTQERFPYVKRAYIYTARDETGFDQENNNFGLYTLKLQPKPAVAALERFLSMS